MPLASHQFLSHLDLVKFVNTNSVGKANILKIDTDSSSGGWVLWEYGLSGATQTLYAQQFMRHTELTDFVNAQNILTTNILKIDADPTSGGWTLFWFV